MQGVRHPHPNALRTVNTIGAALRALRLPIAELKVEPLCRIASKQTGLSDFGDPYYREGLQQVLLSAERDANLHFWGRFRFHYWLVLQLTNRLLLVETLKRQPETFQRPLLPPLIIIGLPRTGTTLLHRMLALDPAHRGVASWEMTRPIPPQDGSLDRRRQTAQRGANLQAKLNVNIDHKHYTSPDEPEECMFMLGLTFVTVIFWLIAPVFGYMEWFMGQNLFEKKYQDYRRLLQVLQSVHPARRLIMKAPEHTPAIDVLLEAIPQALVLQTHRNPLAVVPSTNSLVYSNQISGTNHIDVKRMAEANLQLLKWDLACNLAARGKCAGRIYDLQYEQIVNDPVGTMREIYRHFNLEWPDGFERCLQAYIEQNPKDKHGSHRYQPEDFGQTAQEIAQAFRDYNVEFGYA